jgi:hypothetical protein
VSAMESNSSMSLSLMRRRFRCLLHRRNIP